MFISINLGNLNNFVCSRLVGGVKIVVPTKCLRDSVRNLFKLR